MAMGYAGMGSCEIAQCAFCSCPLAKERHFNSFQLDSSGAFGAFKPYIEETLLPFPRGQAGYLTWHFLLLFFYFSHPLLLQGSAACLFEQLGWHPPCQTGHNPPSSESISAGLE